MEKSTPARNSRTCTADLLNWSSEVPPPSSVSRSRQVFFLPLFRRRARCWGLILSFLFFFCGLQLSNGIGKVLFGGDVSDEEAESLYKRWSFLNLFKIRNGKNFVKLCEIEQIVIVWSKNIRYINSSDWKMSSLVVVVGCDSIPWGCVKAGSEMTLWIFLSQIINDMSIFRPNY